MKKLLVVEDHVGLRESYQMLFIREGYDVTLAEDGKSGLELAQAQDFDIIMLDMLMPIMDGISFLRQFVPADHPKTKIIAFSNLQTPEIVSEAMDLGVKRYVTKAVTPPGKMAELVREVVNEDY
ncbi:MAG: response regulator [Candidatus Saccharimonadales bacterium]